MARKSPDLSRDELERRAGEDLAGGRFRRAKDSLKILVKIDRDRFLPDLIQAYKGLAREMIMKGQEGEAKTVVEYLQTLTGEKLDLSTLFARPQNSADSVQSSMRDCAPCTTGYDETDYLVLSLHQTSTDPNNADALERNNVHSALQLVSEEKYDEALEALRPITLKSRFSYWRLFIKGMCAWYRGDDSMAATAFEKLPPETVPWNAAQVFLFLSGRSSGSQQENRNGETFHRHVSALAGFPKEATVLARAEYLWEIGRHRDSYKHARAGFDKFPSATTGLPQRLRRFYHRIAFEMEPEKADRYLSNIYDTVFRNTQGNPHPLETSALLRTTALALEKNGAPSELIEDSWLKLIEGTKSTDPAQVRYRAAVHLHLGEMFSKIQDSAELPFFLSFGGGESQIRDASRAETHLLKSIEARPSLKSYKLLIGLYKLTGNTSGLNRTLDKMVSLFPEDRETLVQAGSGCVDRRAMKKGITYLEKAVHLDPTDRSAKRFLNRALMSSACEQAIAGKVQKFRSLIQQALQNAEEPRSPLHAEFALESSWILAVLACCEHWAGNWNEAKSARAAGARVALSVPSFDFFLCVVPVFAGKESGPMTFKQWSAVHSTATVTLTDAVLMIQALEYVKGEFLGRRDALDIIKKVITSQVRPEPSPEIAFATIEGILRNQLCPLYTSAKKLLTPLLRDNPGSLHYRLYECKLLPASSPAQRATAERRLSALIVDAKDQGNAAIVAEAQELLRTVDPLRRLLPPGLDPSSLLDIFGDDDDDEEDDDDDDDWDLDLRPPRMPRRRNRKK